MRPDFPERFRFFRAFMTHPRLVGAVLPTSRRAVRDMLDLADVPVARRVVELGVGTGVYTREVLVRLGPDVQAPRVAAPQLKAAADVVVRAVHGSHPTSSRPQWLSSLTVSRLSSQYLLPLSTGCERRLCQWTMDLAARVDADGQASARELRRAYQTPAMEAPRRLAMPGRRTSHAGGESGTRRAASSLALASFPGVQPVP